MYPVYTNTAREWSNFSDLRDNLVHICNTHRKEGRALAFAFLLYDISTPHFRKMIEEKVYYEALNEVSGNFMTIFSIHAKEVRRVRARTGFDIDNLPAIDTGFTMTHAGMVYGLTTGEATQDMLSKYFGQPDEFRFPGVLFFQVDNDKVVEAMMVEINDVTPEQVYNDLIKMVNTANIALRRIDVQYKDNHKEIFDQVEGELKRVKIEKKIKRIATFGKSIYDLAGGFIS